MSGSTRIGEGSSGQAGQAGGRRPPCHPRGCPAWRAAVSYTCLVVAAALIATGWFGEPATAQAAEPGGISGKVTSAASKEAIAGIEVCAFESTAPFAEGCKTTDSSGEYSINELPAGSYSVSFFAPAGSNLNYIPLTYATAVAVASGSVTPHIDGALQPGAQVKGTVVAEGSKSPIAGIEVCAYPVGGEFEGFFGACATTNGSGEYTLSGLESGEYKVQFFPPYRSSLNYLPQYYSNKTYADADVLHLTAGTTTSGIDATLTPGGEINGRATSAATKAAIAGLEVCARSTTGEGYGCALTDASGAYTIAGLTDGSYRVQFLVPYESSLNYLPQYYNDKTGETEAEAVAVKVGTVTPNIDAAMQAGGTITGTVTAAATKAALAHVQVCASGSAFRCASTSSTGEYAITSLPTGSYTVSFPATGEYAPQVYNEKLFSSEATPVSVTAGSTSPGIDAALQLGGTITGVVTSAATSLPLEGITVCRYAVHEEYSGQCTSSNAKGEYSIAGLAATEYKVAFSSYQANYLAQYYNGKGSSAEADPVSVGVGETKSGIDAAMPVGAQITGTVTAAATKAAVSGAGVTAYTSSGTYVASTTTNSKGEYTLPRLTTGTYNVLFSATEQDLVSEYYEHKNTLSEATGISVTAGATTGGINASLQAGGSIAGVVTDAATKAPLSGADVEIATTSGEFAAFTSTNASGEYKVQGLREGSYKVSFFVSGYESQYYNAKANFSEATPVAVTAGKATEGVSAAMQSFGSISGTVTDAATHAAVAGVSVCDYPESGGGTCTNTNGSGEYSFTGLSAGNYAIGFFPGGTQYLGQFYSGKATLGEATKVAVTHGAVTAIDAALQEGGQIKGTVTSKSSGVPLANIEVCAEPTGSEGSGNCASTASDGTYDVGGLQTGSYRVSFQPSEGANYVRQYYSGKEKYSEATPVGVTAGKASEAINAALIEGGQIKGVITTATSKVPLAHAGACAYLPEGETYRCGYTNGSGEYTINGLPSGSFVVYFFPTEGEYSIQYYKEASTAGEATNVAVTEAGTTTGIDGSLKAPGRITGTVTSAASSKPVSGISVCALSANQAVETCTTTGAGGEYTLSGVAPGKHKVSFSSSSQSYETQYYSGKLLGSEATVIEVGEGATTEHIDAAMVEPGEVSGRVTVEGSETGIGGIQVCAEGTSFHCANTETTGQYKIGKVPAGSYKVSFYAPPGLNYIQQYYSDKSSYEEAEAVTVTAGADTGSINAGMKVGGEIKGTVTSAKTASAIQGIEVCPYFVSTGGTAVGCATTSVSGEYTIEKLPTGEYRVGFSDPFNSSLNFIRRFYNGKAHLGEGQKLAITAGAATSGINAALEPGGEVSGTVTRIDNKALLKNIEVCAYGHGSFESVGPCVLTNSSGEYTLRGLPPGLATVEFAPGNFEYFTQYYKEVEGSDEATGVPVEVLHDTTGINARLKHNPPLVPEALSPPVLSGTPQQGVPFLEKHADWNNAPTEYRYQWLRCNSLGLSCLAIKGAENQSYTPVALDVGGRLEVEESASNLEGESEPAISQPSEVVVPAKPANLAPPSISGEARQGGVLKESHGSWTNEPTEYTYQWERCDSKGENCIFPAHSTEETFTLTSTDIGHTIRVIETAINAGGESEPAVSKQTTEVVPAVPVNISPPSITGTARQGETLKESHGSWTNEPSPGGYTYQWERCNSGGTECAPIAEATAASYDLTAADVGHKMVVAETASNTGGPSKPATSGPTLEVAGAVPVNTAQPTISGEAREGGSLTESHGSWTNEPTAFTYQWERCTAEGAECKPILGASEQTYAPTEADVGHELVVEETASNATGPSLGATSEPSPVIVTTVPADVTAPTITGTPRQGEALHEHHGSWTNEPTSYEIQWERCDTSGENCSVAAGGTEDSEYLLSAEDLGHTIRAVEIAHNAGGASQPATSEPTARVVAAAPVNTAPPTTSGKPVQNETLTETPGSWTNEPSSTTRQWERCSSSGSECAPIKDATEAKYVLTAADVGHRLIVVETAANAGGESKPASSTPTAVIGPPVPVNTAPPKIAGKAQVGSTLTEEHGEWTNEPTEYTYQWERCNSLGIGCLPIKGATKQTYTIEPGDLGFMLVVVETAGNATGPGSPAASSPAGPVTLPPPVNTAAPKISGSAESGQTLLANHGTWTNGPTEYREQWLRCDSGGGTCAPIHDAINVTYAPAAADVGHTLRVQETAGNSGGLSEPAQSDPTAVVIAAPLHADAGENIETITETPVTFDGSGSSPAGEITGAHWDFGDGASAEGEIVHHAYASPGKYTATLIVERGGESSKASISVVVVGPEHEATITTVDEGKHPLEGTEVLYVGPGGSKTEALTDASGQAKLPNLPDGTDTVYLYKEGYKPAVGQVSVSGGSGEATVTLTAGALGEAKLKDHEMTLKEIEEAGINPNEEGNNNVYEFVGELAFGELNCHVNSEGRFVGLESCGGGGPGPDERWTEHGICREEVCIGSGGVDGHPVIETLILHGKVSVLKQFFAVSMIVTNLSPEPFRFTHGSATLTVPSGMSLAPTPRPQTPTQNVTDVAGGSNAETNWILRGDEPGEYYLSASYHGQLEPFAAPFELQAATDTPLKVWGAEALGFDVKADSGSLQAGVPYHVKIGIIDKATIPLYNVALDIGPSLNGVGIYQPDQQLEANVGELKPGETLYAPQDIVVPADNSAGAFEPEKSSVHFVGEEAHPGKGIEAVTPPPLYAMSASVDGTGLVHLHWQASPGAEGYEVFSTPSLKTPFAAGPDTVLTSPGSKEGVTRLAAGATDAYIHANTGEPPRFYAVTTIVGGQLRLEHPVKEPVLPSGPAGGPLTLRELLAGGHNPSEFCIKCFMAKLLAFAKPVDGPTGNFWHSFTDLSIPGRGLPLNLTRTYNSGAASSDGPFGFGWSFPYGMTLSFPDATHVVVNQENGSAVEFTEETGGTWAAPPRVTATLSHNGDGSWTFVRRHRETFNFNGGGQLSSERDRNGYTTTLSYNEKGRLVRVTDPAGRSLMFDYGSGGHIVKAVDPLKRVVRYEYDKAGDLTDVSDVAGGDTHFTYDAQHRMLSMRLPDQAPGVPGSTEAALHNTYDEQGRVIKQTDQLGRTTTFEYSGEPLGEAGGYTTITDPKGNVTRQTYQFGELMSETRGYGTGEAATWKFEYDPKTLGVMSVTDPNGHITKSTYDSEGNLLTSEDALGRTTVNTYDGLNDLLTATDPLGVTTTMTYDAHGNLLSRSTPLVGTEAVQTTTYTYGDSSHPGDITAMTDPEGHVSRYTYDKYGDRNSTTDPVGNLTTSTYNVDGWKLTEVSPRGNASGKQAEYTTSYAYNNFGQTVKTTDPLGHATSEEYDPNQNLVATINGVGHTTKYSYDAADERVAEHRANGTTTQTTYWPDGTVKEQIDAAGHATNYGYDALARRTSTTDPLGRTTHYTYDAAGNQTSTDPEGQVTAITYDAANEKTSVSYSDGKTPNVTGITYDADGQRIAQTDGSGSWSWHWDSLHRLTSVTEGTSGTVGYRYDLRGLVTGITYPNGKVVTHTYDGAGRLQSVTDWRHETTSFGYDRDSNIIREMTPSGVVDSFVFDRADQMSETTDKLGTNALFAATYARNANSQVTSDSSATPGQGSYGYTALNQLCYAGTGSGEACTSPPSGASSYAYDNGDNLTQDGASAQGFDAANQLCWSVTGSSSRSCSAPPAGATIYTYDQRGNRVAAKPASGPATALTYDQANRLTHYVKGATNAAYAYGDGLRMSKTVGKAATGFGWDLSGELPLIIQAGKTSYIYGPEGLPIEQITGATNAEWLHHDQLGSTRLITTTTGAVVGTYTYNPWGAVANHTGTATTALGFNGQYADAESGYVYLRTRYYDPATGQFLTQDPAFASTLSEYAYASNDPANVEDPTGLCSWYNVYCEAVQPTAHWVDKHAIQPAGNWVNNHVLLPIGNWLNRPTKVPGVNRGQAIQQLVPDLLCQAASLVFGHDLENFTTCSLPVPLNVPGGGGSPPPYAVLTSSSQATWRECG